jgi:hypothetical protein
LLFKYNTRDLQCTVGHNIDIGQNKTELKIFCYKKKSENHAEGSIRDLKMCNKQVKTLKRLSPFLHIKTKIKTFSRLGRKK